MATTTSTELETFQRNIAEPTSGIAAQPNDRPAHSSAVLPRQISDSQRSVAASYNLPKGRALLVITQLAGINFITSFSNGLVTVALPAMATELDLHENLLLWPTSVYALTGGTCLLLAGSFADVIGPKSVNLTGCFFLAVFILAGGFSRNGIDIIMFRAMQGVASALVVPSSISIISTSVESGKPRNLGFASLGLAMPLGFSFGMVLGGVFVSRLSWRAGYYIGGAVSFLLAIIGLWALPAPRLSPNSESSTWKRLAKEIDWVGASIASTSLALFSYVLAMLSADINNIKRSSNLALLILSVALVPSFALWMWRQERQGRPALIPNSIWKNKAFTSICVMVLLTTAVVNCMELFSSLFFQEVQGTSALGASLRILPNMVLGICTNFMIGMLVNRLSAVYSVLISSGLCAVAPLLMALINPQWPYWYDAFFAQLLAPLGADVLFTVGILIVSDGFPARTQALAGAVFNTLAQLGTSIGLTVTSVISSTVTKESGVADKNSPHALMKGYRASFWTIFAWMVTACLIGGVGLRKLGKIGQKRD